MYDSSPAEALVVLLPSDDEIKMQGVSSMLSTASPSSRGLG